MWVKGKDNIHEAEAARSYGIKNSRRVDYYAKRNAKVMDQRVTDYISYSITERDFPSATD